MNTNLPSYDSISIEMLELLTELSGYINRITALNNSLLKCSLFNRNSDFNKYIYYFDIGRYYHFRCMGYMECLVLTQCYSIRSLCYWKNELVMPADENFAIGLDYLNLLKSNCRMSRNPKFKLLMVETAGLSNVANEIMKTIECYHLPC